MNLYLDSSALVKRYVREPGALEVRGQIALAAVLGTAALTRVEMAAAFARVVRMKVFSKGMAWRILQGFYADWESMVHIPITPELIDMASDLAWEHNLRGYDAIHLASALTWQRLMAEPVTFAVFDRQLWKAALAAGLDVFPDDIERWSP